jgi:hypothetical protein
VLDPEVLTAGGLKLAEAPEGRPFTFRLTLPVNPPTVDTEIVYERVSPAQTMLRDGGFALNEKSGLGFTTSVTEDVCTKGPEVPVIVSG